MKVIGIALCSILLHSIASAATITVPDEVAGEVVQKAKDAMEQYGRAKIGPLVNADTPLNLYQDLKTRAIQDAGFTAVDKDGKDLLNDTPRTVTADSIPAIS